MPRQKSEMTECKEKRACMLDKKCPDRQECMELLGEELGEGIPWEMIGMDTWIGRAIHYNT